MCTEIFHLLSQKSTSASASLKTNLIIKMTECQKKLTAANQDTEDDICVTLVI